MGGVAQEGVDLIISFEGYLRPLRDGTDRVKPYLCPANVPTIGYGNTRYPDGRKVRMGDPPIDRATAKRYFQSELDEDIASVNRLVKVPVHPLMHAALVSFCYNCGAGALQRSGLLRAVNAKRWNDVPREFAKWRMGGGRVLAGLVRRRKAESDLFVRGVAALKRGDTPVAKDRDLPSPVTPPIVAPKTVSRPARVGLWQRLKNWWTQ